MLPGYFNIRSLSHAIFIPTWLNLASFWLQKPTKIASWRRLGASWARLGGLLGRLGRVLERLGLILERLGASWAHLEASWTDYVARGNYSQLCLAAGNSQRFTKTLERLPTESYLYRKTTEDRVNVKIKSECRE